MLKGCRPVKRTRRESRLTHSSGVPLSRASTSRGSTFAGRAGYSVGKAGGDSSASLKGGRLSTDSIGDSLESDCSSTTGRGTLPRLVRRCCRERSILDRDCERERDLEDLECSRCVCVVGREILKPAVSIAEDWSKPKAFLAISR